MLCICFYILSKALQSLCCIFDFMQNQNKFFLSYLILAKFVFIDFKQEVRKNPLLATHVFGESREVTDYKVTT